MPQAVVCTGNPTDRFSIAHAVKMVLPDTVFLHRTAGYDLTLQTPGSEDAIREILSHHTVLINSSHIGLGVQTKLLEMAREMWQSGRVINIGSTSELSPDTSHKPDYAHDKLRLRERSLELHSRDFLTTHITRGGLNNGNPDRSDWIKTTSLAKLVKYIIESDLHMPHIILQESRDRMFGR